MLMSLKEKIMTKKCELFKNAFREVLNYAEHCTVLSVIQVPPSP